MFIGGAVTAGTTVRLVGAGREGVDVFIRTRFLERVGTGLGRFGVVVTLEVIGVGHGVRFKTTRLSGVASGSDGVIIQLSSNSTPTASALPTGTASANRLISRLDLTFRFDRRHGDLFDPRRFTGINDAD